MSEPNPFLAGVQTAPATISDALAPQALPGAAPAGYNQAGQFVAQGQHPAQQAPAQQLQGQPWTPQQHETYNQMREAGMSAAPAGWAPPAPVPATPQPTDHASQFAAHAAYAQNPAAYQTQQQMQAPAPAQQQFSPNGFAPTPQQAAPAFAGAPAFATPGGQVDPSIFGAPAPSGGGRRPGWRDLEGRFVLVRVLQRGVERDTYDKKGKELTLDARVAVLDGGQIVMSPKQGDPSSVAEVYSNDNPCVIDDMIVTSKGLQNRLKGDFTRGRIVREPINDLQKHLREVPGDEPLWWKLRQWLAQDPKREVDFKQSIMWSIVADESDAANQMTVAFVQSPQGQQFCR